MGSGPNWYQIGSKACYISKVSTFLRRKRIFMSTGLKVSSLTCNCVCYTPKINPKGDPMKLNLEGLEMQK